MTGASATIDWKVRYGDAEASHIISLTLPPLQDYKGTDVLLEFEWPPTAMPNDIKVDLGETNLTDAKIRSEIFPIGSNRIKLKASVVKDFAYAVRGDRNYPQNVTIQFRQPACIANCFRGVRTAAFPISITRTCGAISLTFELPRSGRVVRGAAWVLAWLRRRSIAYQLSARYWCLSRGGLSIDNSDDVSGTVIASFNGFGPLAYPAIDIVFRMPFDAASEQAFGYVVTLVLGVLASLVASVLFYFWMVQ